MVVVGHCSPQITMNPIPITNTQMLEDPAAELGALTQTQQDQMSATRS